MSDPQRHPDDHPRRAEPLQPDKPGRGLDSEPGDVKGNSTDESLKRAEGQEKAAVDNVNEGYD
jgi:hypothetical protein